MNNKTAAKEAVATKAIPYFNGGLFATVAPVELTKEELELLGKRMKGPLGRTGPR